MGLGAVPLLLPWGNPGRGAPGGASPLPPTPAACWAASPLVALRGWFQPNLAEIRGAGTSWENAREGVGKLQGCAEPLLDTGESRSTPGLPSSPCADPAGLVWQVMGVCCSSKAWRGLRSGAAPD